MSPASPSQTPIVRFLGEEAGRGGPFALLGLKHDIEGNAEINRAVQRRLRQIECHPHRSTPDAQEVRLAIHSAASQLRDPTLREHLTQRWPEGSPIDLPRAWAPRRAMQKITPALMQHARRIVGSSGGWNPVARRRLAHLARINRLGALEVIRALGGAQTSTARTDEAQRPLMPIKLPAPPDTQRGWIAAYTILGLLVCMLVITAVLQPPVPTHQSVQGPISDTTTTPGGRVESPYPTNTAPRAQLTHYTAIAHELDRLVARAPNDPQGAAERFGQIYPLFISRWTEFPRDALHRASVNIAELIVRLENGGVPTERLVPLLGSAGASPDREMIAAAVIEVTLSSSQLSPQTRSGLRTLRARLSDAPVASQQQGVRASIVAIAEHLALNHPNDDPGWWEPWLFGAKHASDDDRRAQDRLVLSALGNRLRANEPTDKNWFTVASMLVRSLDWREGSDERYWLLERFGDDRVSTPRLATLTEALVAASAAEGVDARMVLEPTANDPQREQMAQSYQEAWFSTPTASAAGTEGAEVLLNRLRLAITQVGSTISDDRAAEHILDLAALTLAAEMHHIGERLLGEELLQNPPRIRDATPASLDQLLSGSPEDDEWAERAVNIENAAQLRPLIDQLLARDHIGINSAHALVYLATAKLEPELGDLATMQLVRASEQPGVLLAIDHALSEDRVSSRLDELVVAVLGQTLPSRTDQRWFHEARLGVLARMSESFSRASHAKMGVLQRELENLLRTRIKVDQATSVPDDLTSGRLMGVLNRSTRLGLESDRDVMQRAGHELGRADAQAIVMRRRARSPLDAYLAELEYAMRLQRIAIGTQYRGAADTLDRIEEERRERMSASGSVLQQIVHTQRAIAQQWAIQIERGPSS